MKPLGLPALRIAILTLLFGAAAGSIIPSAKPSYADVKFEGRWGPPIGEEFPHTGETVVILISNTITKADNKFFAQHEADFEADELEVDLDSTGGDVDTAMQIGRIIRKYEGYTVVSPNDKCYSSCALIYSAGVRRFNHGVIGLHRPYFSSAPQSRQSIEREVPLMLQKLKAYVQEMGNTDIFYQEMVNTEPSAIKLYAGDDIKRIIPELDPTYDEVQTSYDAREYGVTTAEIRQRKKDAETCSGRSDAEICRKAIYWGLSERVYENRKKNMHCVHTFEEVKSWELVKRKELKDHPSILKYEACVRNTMLGH